MASDTPIVVTGGSVTIDFDPGTFKPNGKKFQNLSKRIKRIEITGDGISINQPITDGKVTIKIHIGDP